MLSPGISVGSGVPARIAIISGAESRAWSPRTLGEAVRRQPGFALYDDLGSAIKATLVARGFTVGPVVGLPQGISVFLDGVPVNEPDAGQVNLELLPLAHVRHVEILSGTASLLGPHSLGGAINLVTRRGEATPVSEAAVSLGSYGTLGFEASSGGRALGLDFYAGAGRQRERGWRQLTRASVEDALLNVGRFGDGRGLGVQLFAARSRAETAGSLPFSVYVMRADSNLTAGDFEALDQVHVAATGYRSWTVGRASASVYLRHHDAERFNVNQAADPDVRSFSRNRVLGFQGDWRGTIAQALTFRAGVGGQGSQTSVRLLTERIDPRLTTDVHSPIRKLNAFLLGNYALGRATLSGGARLDVVRVPFQNRLNPARDTTNLFRRVSPRAGVAFAMAPGLSLHASVGQSFRTPAVIELACADPEEPCPLPFALGDDPPLLPVVATTVEAGGSVARGPLIFAVAAYRTDVRDDIFLFPYVDATEPEGSTIDGFFGNVARTRRVGAELTSRLVPDGRYSFEGSVGATSATFQSPATLFTIRSAGGGTNDVRPGDRMPLVPAITAALSLTAGVTSDLEAGASVRYVGRRWMRGDEANETAPLASHTTTDARLSWKPGAWKLELLARNVLGNRYASFGTFNINQGAGDALERFLTPAEPRTFRVTVARSGKQERRRSTARSTFSPVRRDLSWSSVTQKLRPHD